MNKLSLGIIAIVLLMIGLWGSLGSTSNPETPAVVRPIDVAELKRAFLDNAVAANMQYSGRVSFSGSVMSIGIKDGVARLGIGSGNTIVSCDMSPGQEPAIAQLRTFESRVTVTCNVKGATRELVYFDRCTL